MSIFWFCNEWTILVMGLMRTFMKKVMEVKIIKNTCPVCCVIEIYYMPVWKAGRIVGIPAEGWPRPQGFRFLSQRVFIRSLSNLVNMLVGIISRPSSITSQIHPGTPELWPLNCPKLGFPLSKSKSFHPVFIKLKWICLWA